MQTITQILTKVYNYYFLTHLQCSLNFACKFIPWCLCNKQKVCENNNLLCAGNTVFVKYKAQGVNPNSNPHFAYAFE